MGLKEDIRNKVRLTRDTVILETSTLGSGSVDLGSAYLLLSIETDIPCRFRLYDTLESLENATEISRLHTNTNVPGGISLVGDFNMPVAGAYSIDPTLYGVVPITSYYRVSASLGQYPTVKLARYLLEDKTVSQANRKTLNLITGSLTVGQRISGSISSVSIPRTYLFVSASSTNPNGIVRLRLYTKRESISNQAEVTRSFATESVDNNLLIDAILSASSTTYFSPKIVGANLQNIQGSLATVTANSINGLNEMYYVFENIQSSVSPLNTTASLHLFSLED